MSVSIDGLEGWLSLVFLSRLAGHTFATTVETDRHCHPPPPRMQRVDHSS